MYSLSNGIRRNLIPLLEGGFQAQGRNMSQTTTVDPKDTDLHRSLAKDWWDPNGPMKALHSMNTLRLPFICNGLVNTGKIKEQDLELPRSLKGIEILDVGCGGGILSIPLARIGGTVTGLDPVVELTDLARSKAAEESDLNIEFVASTIEDHAPLNKEKYDAVVLSEVVEHITDKDLFLKLCADVVKPGGSLFITTLSQTKPSWLLGILLAENVLGLVPKGTHQWDKFISPNDLQEKVEKLGFSVKLINGMSYIPFVNKWWWSPDKSINYALHAVK